MDAGDGVGDGCDEAEAEANPIKIPNPHRQNVPDTRRGPKCCIQESENELKSKNWKVNSKRDRILLKRPTVTSKFVP